MPLLASTLLLGHQLVASLNHTVAVSPFWHLLPSVSVRLLLKSLHHALVFETEGGRALISVYWSTSSPLQLWNYSVVRGEGCVLGRVVEANKAVKTKR